MIGCDGPRLRFAPHSGPGRLITVEGLDGSGKTTLVKLLCDYLVTRGVPVVATRIPTTHMRQSEAFDLLRNQGRCDLVDPVAFEIEYMADRIQHCRTFIDPALRAGETVIVDRYAFSSIGTLLLRLPQLHTTVLQAIFSDTWFTDLCRYLTKPDLSLVLRTAPETGTHRLRSRPGEADVNFGFEEYGQLQELLLQLARANDMPSIDTAGSPQEALSACLPHLDRLQLPLRDTERL